MIVKIVVLFLVVMAVMAMFGKLRLPKMPGLNRLGRAKCRHCGRHRIGRGPCPCGKG